MTTLLFKTEPSEYAFADLVREKRTVWSGVSNPAARIAIRQARAKDEVLIYHTGDEKAIVGLARVARAAYEDPQRPGQNDRGEPLWPVVDLTPMRGVKTPVALADLREDPRFADFVLLRQSRLSAMLVPPELDTLLRARAGL